MVKFLAEDTKSTVRKDRITFFNAQEIEQRAHVEASVFSATR